MKYELRTEQFSGPIEKLLELIEEKKMEITELNLAEVTADFLNHLKRIEQIEPRLLADFVVVAAHLILIKSKALLPSIQLTAEEEGKVKDLESRLRFHQNFKPAMNHFKELWERNDFSVSRPLFKGRAAFFYPSEGVKINALHSAIENIFNLLRQSSLETKIVKSSLVSLEEKINEVVARLEKALNFRELIKENSKSEIVILFLAVLHLLKDQIIKVEQNEKFSDIIINKIQS